MQPVSTQMAASPAAAGGALRVRPLPRILHTVLLAPLIRKHDLPSPHLFELTGNIFVHLHAPLSSMPWLCVCVCYMGISPPKLSSMPDCDALVGRDLILSQVMVPLVRAHPNWPSWLPATL